MKTVCVLKTNQIINKVTNNQFGLFVSSEWKRLIDPYTPRQTGALSGFAGQTVSLKPFEIHYKSAYAHYMYNGEIYADPIYNVGGFYDETYGWWSRPGIQKIPTGRSFEYSKNINPFAIDHWDIVAAESGQLDKLYRTLNNALQSGRF